MRFRVFAHFAADIASSALRYGNATPGFTCYAGYSIDSLRFFTLSCRFD
jgi:hypothetical protein